LAVSELLTDASHDGNTVINGILGLYSNDLRCLSGVAEAYTALGVTSEGPLDTEVSEDFGTKLTFVKFGE
jgi:hypothetical protein